MHTAVQHGHCCPLATVAACVVGPLQFGAPLREQLDLATEAKHLEEFGTNFRHWSGVTFPQVWHTCWLEKGGKGSRGNGEPGEWRAAAVRECMPRS